MPIPQEWNLSGKVVVLTTGGRGWGPILAAGLAEAGANLALIGHRQEILEASTEAVKEYGRRVLTIQADLRRPAAVRQAMRKVARSLGRIDALVNDTQVEFAKPILEITPAEYDGVMDRNVKSVFLSCQEAGRYMVKQGSGRIVNLCSVLAERGVSNESVYCASMGAIGQLTRAMGLEWARNGITVNGIGTAWYTLEDIALEQQQEQPLVRYLPSRRLGKPQEIVPLLVLLCSDASSYVNGQTIFVDGGAMTHA
ncbi:MAG: SDR family oxidoreductase [Dehalococcoidia bacterium]|nr:SDR family oxidoreductase [Dehalococcoidia bacterium]